MHGNTPKDENFGFFTSPLYALFARAFPSMKSFYSFILDDISKYNFSSLLDIGCGPGILDAEIASRFPERRILGIDPSKYMIRHALAIARKKGLKNLDFKIGKNMSIPVDSTFDMIITTLSFHHWAVKREAVAYIAKFLSTNGIFAIYEFLKPESGMAISGSHSLSVSEAKSYSDIKGLKISEIAAIGKFIKVAFTKA